MSTNICKKFPNLAKMLFETPFWCAAPFSSITMSVDGDYSLCCVAADFKFKIKDKSIAEYFQSDDVINVKKEMLSGVPQEYCKKHCYKCLDHEKMGSFSRRQRMNANIVVMMKSGLYDNILSKIETTIHNDQQGISGKLSDFGFTLIDFKIFGNLCNLKCMMCHPDSSNLVAKEQIALGIYDGPENYNPYEDLSESDKQRFFSELKQILPNTKTIRFTGGEPSISKSIIEILKFIVGNGYSTNLDVHITTNGTILNQTLLDLLLKFRAINVSVSVDGYEEINEMQRRNSKFSDIDKHLEIYHSYKNIDLYIVPTVTSFNCSRLEELQFYSKYKINRNLHLSFCLKPKQFSILHLPDEIRELYKTKLQNSKYNFVFKDVITILNSGIYDERIFKIYLTRIIELYGKDKILKLFPEYIPYVV